MRFASAGPERVWPRVDLAQGGFSKEGKMVGTLENTMKWRQHASYGLGALYAGLTGLAVGWFITLGTVEGLAVLFG